VELEPRASTSTSTSLSEWPKESAALLSPFWPSLGVEVVKNVADHRRGTIITMMGNEMINEWLAR